MHGGKGVMRAFTRWFWGGAGGWGLMKRRLLSSATNTEYNILWCCVRVRACVRARVCCDERDRAPAPTPPTCADPCADLAPTLPPTLPPTAASWRRTPWLVLPCAVCADRRRPADQRQPSPNRMPGPPQRPARGPRLPAPPIYTYNFGCRTFC
jgi:hypothetical protein